MTGMNYERNSAMYPIERIYVAGALTKVEKTSLKETYLAIAEVCSKVCSHVYVPHASGTDPVKDPNVTPETVWRVDHREVSAADMLVAYVGEPSLGVGAELEIARITASDIVLWWFEGEKVSRMALGNPAVVHTIEAKDEKNLLEQLEQFLIRRVEGASANE